MIDSSYFIGTDKIHMADKNQTKIETGNQETGKKLKGSKFQNRLKMRKMVWKSKN